MDGEYKRLLVEEALVAVDRHFEDFALGVHLPAGIALVGDARSTSQFKGSTHRSSHILQIAGHARTLRGVDHHLVAFFANAGQIAGSLHKVFQVLAHGKHPIVHHHKALDETGCCFAFETLSRRGAAAEVDEHIGFGGRKLVPHVGGKEVQVHTKLFFISGRNGDDGTGFTRDGVVQATGLDVGNADIGLAHEFVDEAHQDFVGIAALLVDVVAGVAAGQPFDVKFHRKVVGRHCHFRKGERSFRAHTTGTAHKELAFVLGVEVEQIVARHEARLQAHSARKAGLFIAGEEAFDGAVLNIS